MNLVLLLDEDFTAPDRALLRGRRADHVRTIHRAEPGQELVVGRLGGQVGHGRVLRLDAEELELAVTLDTPPPPKLAVTLLLALPRPKTLRRVLQCVATMGVARLVLMNSWRVDKSYWKSPLLAPEGVRRELLLGLEQGKDTILPVVELKRLLKPFADQELDLLAAASRKLVAHPTGASAFPRALPEPVTLALGPEGGFIERELDLFVRHGFEPITLGPRPLRVEQAVPALLARLT